MARVTLPLGITRISGRVGNVCFRTMSATGRVYMRPVPPVRTSPLSAAEIENRARFKKRVLLVQQMHNAGTRLSNKELWKIAKQAI